MVEVFFEKSEKLKGEKIEKINVGKIHAYTIPDTMFTEGFQDEDCWNGF